MTTPPILELQSVSKRFDRTVTADRLSLSVQAGDFFTFLGPSGSGKSTILRMIAGLEPPDDGRILIGGRDMAGVPPWRRNLGMMFQSYAVFPHMTVGQNVAYGLKARGVPARVGVPRMQSMLRLVGLDGFAAKNATLLSGGEQQRVALARALAPQPAMLLLDEPLSALDEKIRREMQGELKRIQKETGTTFLYVTHDQEEALTMSDRIAVLDRGIAVQVDAPEPIYARPRTRFVARFFRGCNLLEGELLGFQGAVPVLRVAGTLVTAAAQPATSDAIQAGSRAVAIRAEKLHLDPAAGGRAPERSLGLPATLTEIIYRGTITDYRLALADGQVVTASSTQRRALAPGAALTVRFTPDDLMLLED